MPLTHHELCFGCGSANVFGLQIELEATDRGVTGRFFVKQDHQGPPGFAHPGVLAAALEEAMALALRAEGLEGSLRQLELDLRDPAPIGTFVQLSATTEEREGETLEVAAEASTPDGEERLAAGRATYVVRERPGSV